jgi:hypothetical protein
LTKAIEKSYEDNVLIGSEGKMNSDSTRFLVVNATLIKNYRREYLNCYDTVTNDYQISGDMLLGEAFFYDYIEEKCVTRITRSAEDLILTQTYTGGNEKVVVTNYYKSFDAAIPPANWPKTICPVP